MGPRIEFVDTHQEIMTKLSYFFTFSKCWQVKKRKSGKVYIFHVKKKAFFSTTFYYFF